MLDAHQLNIFLTAADTLNFTKAAQRLHMSQPSVSQHIHSLEKHFGAKLFIRKGRSLSLSDAGRTLIPMARDFVEQSTRIDEAMSSLHGQIQGKILVGCDAEAGKYLLPEHFTRFYSQHTNITITCRTHSLPMPPSRLANGTIHFLVTNDIRNLQKSNYQIEEITEEEISLVVPRDHSWAEETSLSPSALTGERFILFERDTYLSHNIEQALEEAGIKYADLDSFLQLGNSEAIIIAVDKGLGVGFASRTVAEYLNSVTLVPIQGVNIRRKIYVVRNLEYPVTAAREAFWEFISSVGSRL